MAATMQIVVSIIIGILSSLTASFVFLFCISRLRPKIIISGHIAKGRDLHGETVYRVKIINKSKRTIINVKANLHLMTPKIVPGGLIVNAKMIQLKRDDPMQIAGFDQKDKEASYAFRFQTYEDIDKLWDNDATSYLRFRIFAMDSLSGLGKVFRQDYHTKRNSIVDGEFEFGNSVQVK